MGLENQLRDISSESFPILLVALVANCICYLRSLLVTFLDNLGLPFFHCDEPRHSYGMETSLYDAVGSGLAGVIMLAEQLNLNRVFSYKFDDGLELDCVVCLNRFVEGDNVRKLACRHVFHKGCFDGWLDHMNFNCPLCRSPLLADERVEITRRCVTEDVCAWFSWR